MVELKVFRQDRGGQTQHRCELSLEENVTGSSGLSKSTLTTQWGGEFSVKSNSNIR